MNSNTTEIIIIFNIKTGKEDRIYLYIIDFGLSRKYIGIDGEIKPPRDNPGFRGTARYASIYSHSCQDLAPRDDLWSVYYILVEFATGSLPWSKVRDRDKVFEMKKAYLSGTRLVDKLPAEFADLQSYLESLDYYSLPDYQYIIDLFSGLLERTTGSTALPPYDWERRRKSKKKGHRNGNGSHPKKSASPAQHNQQQQQQQQHQHQLHPNRSSTYGSSSGKSPAGTGEESGNDYRWIFKTRRVKSFNAPVGSPYIGPAGMGFSSSSSSEASGKIDNEGGGGGGDRHGKSKGQVSKKSGGNSNGGVSGSKKHKLSYTTSSSSSSSSDSSDSSDSSSSSSSYSGSDSSSDESGSGSESESDDDDSESESDESGSDESESDESGKGKGDGGDDKHHHKHKHHHHHHHHHKSKHKHSKKSGKDKKNCIIS